MKTRGPLHAADSGGHASGVASLCRWIRLSSVKWEDAWVERLRFLGPQKIAFITWERSRALKIEAYCDERTGQGLVERFGGHLARLEGQIPEEHAPPPRSPLSIRGKLKIFSDEPSWQAWRSANRKPEAIFVPAGMAFGTGEHATTGTCLRLLADLTRKSLPAGYTALDLGTGAGILAIGARALGAKFVKAIDCDPVAVRIARENASVNELRRIEISRGNVLRLRVGHPFDVVLANLFSDTLIAAASHIAEATRPGGWLIFSGVLKEQVPEVVSSFESVGFSSPKSLRRGKWCAGICRRKGENP
jgi:ribosomal protein L11 methyltransferase